MNNYDDILNAKRPNSNRPKMSLYNRAAQFSPFSALTGYDNYIMESSKIVEKRIDRLDDLNEILDLKLKFILNIIDEHQLVTFTYFVPDFKKNGGKYVSKTCSVRNVDKVNGIIYLTDNTKINTIDIIEIECEI